MTTSTTPWQVLRKKFEPRPEQIRGIKLILQGKGTRLFLHPGRGKTSTVLKSFQILKQCGYVDSLLVLAPLRVVTTSWPSELQKWSDFESLTYTTIHKKRKSAMQENVDIYLMNFEGLLTPEWWDKKKNTLSPFAVQFLKRKRFMLVVDEATKMKNSQSARFKALKKYLSWLLYPTILTGTPKPKSLEDLFAQCYITDQGRDLGAFITHFRREYMVPNENGYGFSPQNGAFERVSAKIAPTTLQLDYEEAVPSQVVDIIVPMPDDVKPFYKELKDEFIASIQGQTVIAPNSGVLLNKLRQVAQGAIYNAEGETLELHGAKLDALENLVEELDGEPLFCLIQYKHDTARISERLGYDVPVIAAGTSAAQGAAYVQRFSAGEIPLLLGHPQSVAHGVDGLQNNCKNVVWFGLDWSWENYYQANLRIVRHGSKADMVSIYRIMVDCPTERAVLASVEGKRTAEADFLTELKKHLQVE